MDNRSGPTSLSFTLFVCLFVFFFFFFLKIFGHLVWVNGLWYFMDKVHSILHTHKPYQHYIITHFILFFNPTLTVTVREYNIMLLLPLCAIYNVVTAI